MIGNMNRNAAALASTDTNHEFDAPSELQIACRAFFDAHEALAAYVQEQQDSDQDLLPDSAFVEAARDRRTAALAEVRHLQARTKSEVRAKISVAFILADWFDREDGVVADLAIETLREALPFLDPPFLQAGDLTNNGADTPSDLSPSGFRRLRWGADGQGPDRPDVGRRSQS